MSVEVKIDDLFKYIIRGNLVSEGISIFSYYDGLNDKIKS
jgi:hypothetical protein